MCDRVPLSADTAARCAFPASAGSCPAWLLPFFGAVEPLSIRRTHCLLMLLCGKEAVCCAWSAHPRNMAALPHNLS